MSGDDTPDSRIGPVGPMYIVDLLEYLKARNYASWLEAMTIIKTIQRYGQDLAKAERLDDNVCEVRTHIGYGLEAVIEMERDRNGKWQPVFGKIVKR